MFKKKKLCVPRAKKAYGVQKGTSGTSQLNKNCRAPEAQLFRSKNKPKKEKNVTLGSLEFPYKFYRYFLGTWFSTIGNFSILNRSVGVHYRVRDRDIKRWT